MSDQTEIIIKLTVDEEQLDTLRLYQPSDARPVEEELEEAAAQRLQRLFRKNVPLPVQNFLEKKHGLSSNKAERPSSPRRPTGERRKCSRGEEVMEPNLTEEPRVSPEENSIMA